MTNNNNTVWLVLGGIIIGLLLAPWLIPMMGFGSMMGRRTNTALSPRTTSANLIDQHFIEQMIPHHDGAIAMANLALTKATHPEIETLAKDILLAQTKENSEMRLWYRAWFGVDVSVDSSAMMGGMMSQGGMHMGGLEDVTTLDSATDFDKEFIEQMIPHHQMAIMMARMLESGTDRPEMLELAKNIIESQSQEIQKMQGWYQEWYQ
ncbi:MAG: DUF305 domain-containing protein [Patescibacteria group bacterium]